MTFSCSKLRSQKVGSPKGLTTVQWRGQSVCTGCISFSKKWAWETGHVCKKQFPWRDLLQFSVAWICLRWSCVDTEPRDQFWHLFMSNAVNVCICKKFKKCILSTSPSACHWKRNNDDTGCLRKLEIQWFLLKLIKHETNIKIPKCVSLNLNLSSDIHKPLITNCLYYPGEKCSFF